MDNTNTLMRVAESPAIDQVAEPLSKAVRGAYEAAGPAGQRAKNALHGLVRQRGRVCALAHACAHLGGPLSEGTLKDGAVVSPWHGFEFALEDGRVLNGPATHNQPCLLARKRDGRIEVKALE